MPDPTPTPTPTPVGPPSRAARLLLGGLSLGVSLAFCELALRFVWPNPYRAEVPYRVLWLPLNTAGTEYKLRRTQVDPRDPLVRMRTDTRGYILPSRRFARPDATVAFLGGSTTECVAVREELRWPAQVSTLLEGRGLRVNTLNAGRSGNTLHDSLNLLVNHVVDDHPDVVVVMNVANDIGVLSAGGDFRNGAAPTLGSELRWPLQVFSRRSSLVAFGRTYASGARNLVTTPFGQTVGNHERGAVPHPEEYLRRLRAFVRTARAFDIEPVLMTEPLASFRNAISPTWTEPRNQEVFNNFVRQVGAEERVTVIDLAPFLDGAAPGWRESQSVFYDGMHVHDRGAGVYAAHITDRLYATVLARFHR